MVLKNWMFVVSLILIVIGGALFWSSAFLMVWRPSWTVDDETFVIPPGNVRAICRSFPSDIVLTIYVDVLSGGDRAIDFWAMDIDDYYSFTRGERYSYYKETYNPRISETTFRWRPPPNREICFVYINTDLYTSRTVYTKIVGELYTLNRDVILLTIGGALLVAGLTMLVVYRQKSRVSQTPKTMNLAQSV